MAVAAAGRSERRLDARLLRFHGPDEMVAFTVETAMTPFNLSGHPSLCQGTGFTPAGLPLSWQVVGHRFDEHTILRLAPAYERATPWRHERAPVR